MSSSSSSSKSGRSTKSKKKISLLNFNVILSLSDETYLTKDNIVINLGLLNTYPHIKSIMLDIGKHDKTSSSLPDSGLKFVNDEIKDQFSEGIKFDLTNDLINNTDIDISKNYIFITDDITRLDNDKFNEMKEKERYVSILCKQDRYIIAEVLKFLQTLQLDPITTLIDINSPEDRKPTDKELKLYKTIRKSMKVKEDTPYSNQDGGSGELKIRISGTQPPELNDKDVLFFYHNDNKSIKLLTKLFKQQKIKTPPRTKKLKKLTNRRRTLIRTQSIKKGDIKQNTAVPKRVKDFNKALDKIDQERLKNKAKLNQKLDLMRDLLKDLTNVNDDKKMAEINSKIRKLHKEINNLIPQQTVESENERKLGEVINLVKKPSTNSFQLPNLNTKPEELNKKREEAEKEAMRKIGEKKIKNKEEIRLEAEEFRLEAEKKEQEQRERQAMKKRTKGPFARLTRKREKYKQLKEAEKSIKGKKPGIFEGLIKGIKKKLTRKRKKKTHTSPNTGVDTDL